MDTSGEIVRPKTPGPASKTNGIQITSNPWNRCATPIRTQTPISMPDTEWPVLGLTSPVPSASSSHDDIMNISIDESFPMFTENGYESESPTSSKQTGSAAASHLKTYCLFCCSAVSLNGKQSKTGTSSIQSFERRKMLKNLCTHMELNPTRIPAQCPEEKFPFCNTCLTLLKRMWENQKLIREATLSIFNLVGDIERSVVDAEFLKTTVQPSTSSSAFVEQQRFTELRDMILEVYRNKLIMKKVLRERDQHTVESDGSLTQNDVNAGNSTEMTNETVPHKENPAGAPGAATKSGRDGVLKKVTGQNAVNLNSVKVEDPVSEDDSWVENEGGLVGLVYEGHSSLPSTSTDETNGNREETAAPAQMPILKREMEMPSYRADDDQMPAPLPKTLKGPKRTHSFEGIKFFDTKIGNQEIIQCSKCEFNINSIKYRAEGKLPITAMKQHILDVHKKRRTSPTKKGKLALANTSPTHAKKNLSPTKKGTASQGNSVAKPGCFKVKRGRGRPPRSGTSTQNGDLVNVGVKAITKKKKKYTKKKKRRVNTSGPQESHECSLCGRTFDRKCSFALHFKTHKKEQESQKEKEQESQKGKEKESQKGKEKESQKEKEKESQKEKEQESQKKKKKGTVKCKQEAIEPSVLPESEQPNPELTPSIIVPLPTPTDVSLPTETATVIFTSESTVIVSPESSVIVSPKSSVIVPPESSMIVSPELTVIANPTLTVTSLSTPTATPGPFSRTVIPTPAIVPCPIVPVSTEGAYVQREHGQIRIIRNGVRVTTIGVNSRKTLTLEGVREALGITQRERSVLNNGSSD